MPSLARMFGSLLDRHLLENATAKAAQNAADIEYVAMMADVDLNPADSEEMEETHSEV